MMKLRNTLCALLLSISLPAMAEITTLVAAVELSAANLTVPPGPNGRLSFKVCEMDCDDEAVIHVRLTPQTRYVVHGETMEFIDFRREFYNLRRGNDAYTLVTYDTEKDTVTSVQISD